jgi:hypothetical protein
LLFLVAGIFLFANLGTKYLWQDEAATAVLGGRLMQLGQPLAYDGVNLITLDDPALEDAKAIDRRAGPPEAAVQYYVERGDFKGNTAWIAQPWGSLAVAGATLAVFGKNTLAARAPFAAAAFLTVVLLYGLVRRESRNPLLAWVASALLVTNVYWVIHSRQCRYYALSGLFLLLTLIAWVRWQRSRRLGAPLFVLAAWCWFQVDFGSFWPGVGILLLGAAWAAWPRVHRVLVVGLALGAAVAPWVWYYELASRVKASRSPWSEKFLENLFHVNQFLIPLVLLLLAVMMLARRWRTLDPAVRRLLAASLAILLAALVWVPSVAPYAFHRYVVHLAPLAALSGAWVLSEGAAWITRRYALEPMRAWTTVSLAVFVAACPVFSNVGAGPIKVVIPGGYPLGSFLRPEWKVLHEEVFAPLPDPNRRTVEALARVASSGDEVLINYEDIPLMFYTDYRIRGGIPCFRVEDSSRGPARFLVLRRSVKFVYGPVFQREVSGYRLRPIRTDIPDIPWGNMPEPEYRISMKPTSAPKVILAEIVGWRQPTKVPDPVEGAPKTK